jgi:hypothetical protein
MHDELIPEWLTNPESWGCRKRRYAAPILGGWVGRAQKIKGGGDTTLQRLNVCAALALAWGACGTLAMGRKSGTDSNG